MNVLSSAFASPRMQWLLVLALCACYPLSVVIPPAWGWESGIVENAEVAVLALGFLLAGAAFLRLRSGQAAMLACCVMPIWLLMIGRELSWGAVFLAPLGVGPDGPIYSSTKMLWYRPLVVPVACVLLAFSGLIAWRHRLDRLVRQIGASGQFPWGLTSIMLLAALGSTMGEGHLGKLSDYVVEHGESLEELFELVGYVILLALQARVLAASAGNRRSF